MAELSGFRLKGSVHITVAGEPVANGWRGRLGLAWNVLRGRDVQPQLSIVGNSFLTDSGPVVQLVKGQLELHQERSYYALPSKSQPGR